MSSTQKDLMWIRCSNVPVPKDNNEYLLLTKTGVVSGWYCDEEPCFVCYDDKFQIEIEETPHGDSSEVIAWMPIPKNDYGQGL